jgi:S1-C subfamily serine protease
MAGLRRVWTAFLALALIGFSGVSPSNAQEGPAWVQIAALPDLASAEDSARAYSAVLGEVAGYRLGSRWYLVTLGPFSPAEAAGKMASFKAAGQIPRDAFITDGTDHGAQFWPVGAAATAAPTAIPAATEPVTPTPEAPPPPAPADETIDQAQASEAALSRDEKAELQASLQWYGFYEGALDGSIGRGSRASMAAWQTAMGYEPTGVLTSLQRSTLVANHNADEAAFGFTTTTEGEAGIEFALPAAMLAFDHYEPPFVHYTATDGSKLRLLLISEPGDGATLAGLYDLLQTLEVVPAAGERSLQDSEFTINAASNTIASFATAKTSKGAIKGYLLVWEPAQSETAQRILTTLASTFRSTGDQVLDPGLVPLDDTIKLGVMAGMAVKEPTAVVSGIYVDANGMVLTRSDAVAKCTKITLDNILDAEVVASDAALGAAILRPLSPAYPLAVGYPATENLGAGASVLLAGYSLPKGLPAPVLTFGQIQAAGGPSGEAGLLTLAANVTPYDLGGPVLNDKGALLGMIFGTEIGGKTLPQGISLARDISSLAPLLAEANVAAVFSDAAAAALSPDALNAAAMGMTVQIACWP